MNKRQKKRICYLVFPLVVFIMLVSCSGRSRKPFYEADISGIHLDGLNIYRYEQVLFGLNPNFLENEIRDYKDTFAIFLSNIIDDEVSIARLHEFITDPLIIELYNDSKDRWGHTDSLEALLLDAFRYYHYHFPDHPVPDIYTYVSGVDYVMPVKYFDNQLIIGVDNYLGAGYETYARVGVPRYISRRMRPDHLVTDVMGVMADAWLASVSKPPETLLDHMIYQGKRQFFLDCMLPRLPDSLKIGYSSAHHDWIMNNERHAWIYKLDNELIYSTDHRTIQGFINEAPFTSRFSNQSAPRTGVWLGWQIVREYMRRNPEITLNELFMEENSRKILTEARYRP